MTPTYPLALTPDLAGDETSAPVGATRIETAVDHLVRSHRYNFGPRDDPWEPNTFYAVDWLHRELHARGDRHAKAGLGL